MKQELHLEELRHLVSDHPEVLIAIVHELEKAPEEVPSEEVLKVIDDLIVSLLVESPHAPRRPFDVLKVESALPDNVPPDVPKRTGRSFHLPAAFRKPEAPKR